MPHTTQAAAVRLDEGVAEPLCAAPAPADQIIDPNGARRTIIVSREAPAVGAALPQRAGPKKGAPPMAKQKRTKPGKVGHDGQFEVGERIVSDPLEPGARYTAKVNVRESAIAHMASRRRINAAQEAAGERFRVLWERARIGRTMGIDPAKEAVDGGKVEDPLSEDLVRAGLELARAVRAAGQVGGKLLMDIVGEGKLIERVAKDWSQQGGAVKGRRAEGYITGRLVEALDELVKVWRLEGTGRPDLEPGHYLRNGARVAVVDDIVASGPITITGPSREVRVTRFGDVEVAEIVPVDRGPVTVHASGNVGVRDPGTRKK